MSSIDNLLIRVENEMIRQKLEMYDWFVPTSLKINEENNPHLRNVILKNLLQKHGLNEPSIDSTVFAAVSVIANDFSHLEQELQQLKEQISYLKNY